MIKHKGKEKIPNSNRNWNAIVGNKLTNPYRGSADIAPTLTAAMGMGGGTNTNAYKCNNTRNQNRIIYEAS